MKVITEDRCAGYLTRGHPERPARITATLEFLRHQQQLPIDWAEPGPINESQLLRAHSPALLRRLSEPGDFDGDTPNHRGMPTYACRSVGAALEALRCARAGENVFSLMRPPGHHATRDRIMGFCYLNNIAVAALEAAATGFHRIAVFDFDVHHGNGTEDILLNHPGTAFYSIHEYPCYPGTGAANIGDNCFNYPVPPHTPREQYRAILQRALEDMKQFQPDLIAVSAGFDAYVRDPLANGSLEAEDFHWLGRSLRGMGVPMFSLLEGGYSDDLPELIFAYLAGMEGM